MMEKGKIDLRDLTFLIPVRIDSDIRKANLEVLLRILSRDFDSNIIVLEADTEQRVSLPEKSNIEYHLVQDEDPIYHKTKYVNQLIRLSHTPYVAIWDADAIGIPEQIAEALNVLRSDKVVMAYPFDGRFYSLDIVFSQLFHQTMRYDVLLDHIPKLYLMHGYYSPGGAYLVNKEKYMQTGGENENYYGWGQEDAERIKRMDVLGSPLYYTKGPLFHLWHPRKGWWISKEMEIINRKEFLKTCRKVKI